MTVHPPGPDDVESPATETDPSAPDQTGVDDSAQAGAALDDAAQAGSAQADAALGEPDAHPPASESHTTATTLAAAPRRRGAPGWLVVTVATLAVVGAAVAEVLLQDRIGMWTGICLVTVSVIAPLVTRAGDRSLPAMMPPLAFLAATLVAGQALVEEDGGSWRTRQVVMIAETLGENAVWVVAATIVSTTLAFLGYLVDRRRRRR